MINLDLHEGSGANLYGWAHGYANPPTHFFSFIYLIVEVKFCFINVL